MKVNMLREVSPTLRWSALGALIALALLASGPAVASESAVVGHVKADGTIKVYENRFQDAFADGTPVGEIEISNDDGFFRISRWAAEGCKGESAALTVQPSQRSASGFSFQQLVLSEATRVHLFRCEDTGCRQIIGSALPNAGCGNHEEHRCECLSTNLDETSVNVHLDGGWCEKKWNVIEWWSLADWVLVRFIQ